MSQITMGNARVKLYNGSTKWVKLLWVIHMSQITMGNNTYGSQIKLLW